MEQTNESIVYEQLTGIRPEQTNEIQLLHSNVQKDIKQMYEFESFHFLPKFYREIKIKAVAKIVAAWKAFNDKRTFQWLKSSIYRAVSTRYLLNELELMHGGLGKVHHIRSSSTTFPK